VTAPDSRTTAAPYAAQAVAAPPQQIPETAMTTPFIRPLPRTMAIANQKGGVGKTTTAVNLGACLAVLGYRTLVVDLDPQGNASTGLGINIRDLQASMYDVILNDVPLEDCIESSWCRPSAGSYACGERSTPSWRTTTSSSSTVRHRWGC
jgi:Mrp family chromosome partitioning ATPase